MIVAMLGLQLCAGIGYLHSQGYLHLDLKPSNIICHNGQAKLLDLSIGRPPAAWCDEESSYPQLWHRAEPLRMHRRLPAAFGNAIEATLDPDPDKRPTVGELAGVLDPLA